MEALREEGARLATMGAAPLAGLEKEQPPLRWLHRSLRFAYDHLDAFYPFQSLTEYKAKFSPHWWEPKYLVFRPRRIRARLFFSVLKAYDERGASRIVLSKLASAMREELAIDPGTGRPRLVDHALASDRYDLTDAHLAAIFALERQLAKRSAEGAISRWLAACRSKLERRTAEAPQKPADYRRAAELSCNCRDCRALSEFLADPDRRQARFPLAKQRRRHLHTVIDRDHFQIDALLG